MGTGGREHRVGVPLPAGLRGRARARGVAPQPPRLRAGVGMWLCVCGRMGRSLRPGWGERKGERGPVLHAPRIPRRGRSLSARLYGWGTCSVRGAGAVSSRPSQQSGASRHPRHPRHGPPHRYRGAGGQRGAGAGGGSTRRRGARARGWRGKGEKGGKGWGQEEGAEGALQGLCRGAVICCCPPSRRLSAPQLPPRAGDTPPDPPPVGRGMAGREKEGVRFL